MTPEQRAHVDSLCERFVLMMIKKYAAGAAEHGGNLWEKDELYLLDEAIYENIDQFVYLCTLRDKLAAKPKV